MSSRLAFDRMKRTESDDDGPAANSVIDDLVPDQDLNRIRACVAANLEHDNRLPWMNPGISLFNRDEARAV